MQRSYYKFSSQGRCMTTLHVKGNGRRLMQPPPIQGESRPKTVHIPASQHGIRAGAGGCNADCLLSKGSWEGSVDRNAVQPVCDAPTQSFVPKPPSGPRSCLVETHRGLVFAGAVFQDVQLVWENCCSFNKRDSDICKTCDEAQQAFLARWQQQGLPLPAADKKKKGRQSGPATAEAAAAGKGGKKPDVKREQDTTRQGEKAEGKMTKRREASASDTPVAQETAAVGKQPVKRKRGQDSADVGEEEPSSSAAAQLKKASKAAVVKVDLAPEKMSAGARLRKGLPPTPPSRISPRMATAEAASDAAAPTVAPESAPDEAPKANTKGKSKSAALQGANKAKPDSDPPVARRSSGRLK